MIFNSYEDIITLLALSFSAQYDLDDYDINSVVEEVGKKDLILGLYNKAKRLGNELDEFLFDPRFKGIFPRPLEELCDLIDKHWKAVQELFMTIGQDEYDRKITYYENSALGPGWRLSAEHLLMPFYPSG